MSRQKDPQYHPRARALHKALHKATGLHLGEISRTLEDLGDFCWVISDHFRQPIGLTDRRVVWEVLCQQRFDRGLPEHDVPLALSRELAQDLERMPAVQAPPPARVTADELEPPDEPPVEKPRREITKEDLDDIFG